MEKLTVEFKRINEKVIRELSLMSNSDLLDRSIVFRKLACRGYYREAYILFTIPISEYECLITNSCDEIEG